MAEILLKDKNGTETPHSGAMYISVPSSAGGKTNYMSLANARCYFGQIDKISDGVYTFTPKALWLADNVNHGMISTCSDSNVQAYGKYIEETGQYQMAFLFTHRLLTVDKTYNLSEL
jgi:hypothetical protein